MYGGAHLGAHRNQLDILVIPSLIVYPTSQAFDPLDSLGENLDEEIFGYAVGCHDIDELTVQKCRLVFGELACQRNPPPRGTASLP